VKETVNHLIKRLGIFLVIFISLLVLVSYFSFENVYHRHFIKLSNIAFSNFGKGGIVTFKDGFDPNNKKYNDANDCMIILTSKAQKQKALKEARKQGKSKLTYNPVSFPLNSWNNFGFLLLFFIAQIIALPLALKHRFLIFFIGYLLIHFFFYIKIWASINLKYSIWYEEFQVGWISDFFVNLLNYFHIIIMYPFFGMVLITLITLFLSFRYWNIKQN